MMGLRAGAIIPILQMKKLRLGEVHCQSGLVASVVESGVLSTDRMTNCKPTLTGILHYHSEQSFLEQHG